MRRRFKNLIMTCCNELKTDQISKEIFQSHCLEQTSENWFIDRIKVSTTVSMHPRLTTDQANLILTFDNILFIICTITYEYFLVDHIYIYIYVTEI